MHTNIITLTLRLVQPQYTMSCKVTAVDSCRLTMEHGECDSVIGLNANDLRDN